MPKDLVEVKMASLPLCDFCQIEGKREEAQYDFRTQFSSWAYGCQRHYEQHRMHPELGTGKGQRLVLAKPRP